ncbi:TKL/DRK protein kinase [Aphanomyces invadans]|uniref:TKL/DRK protein kinase n=1 Tax=Aphanomyces invadans TaxID=157072 RepID=A0A024U002_9STRA|nr:TKL/DRK protein kinase [Aphanomyces invadans]ETV99750.1 TKL/DRK protein kinase [Aphanomyces invadans]|eukprot:XP_008871526.1 TKL/DRK protein kinase [Aphanomyces invadans]
MAPPTCKQWFLTNFASNMSATGKGSCYLRKALAVGTIDAQRVASEDCQEPTCMAVLNELSIATTEDCTIPEVQSGNPWLFSKVKELCDVPATTGPRVATKTTTAKPQAVPSPKPATTPTVDPDLMNLVVEAKPSWFNTNKAIIIWVGAGVIVCLVVMVIVLWRRNRQQRQVPVVAASVLTQPPPYAPVADRDATLQLQRSSSTTFATQVDPRFRPNPFLTTSGLAPTNTTSMLSATGPLPSVIGIPESLLDMCGLEVHRLASNDLRLTHAIAQGGSGEVWIGDYLGERVALKKLLTTKANSIPDLQKFIWEIKLHSKMESPYVVRFVGVAWTKPANITLVTEFMDGGDLRSILQANALSRTLTWRHKMQCALHVAEGLVYLHTMDPVVIHRDLKSRNVLLDARLNAKITDFGIAREAEDVTMTAGIGTYRWMAPEVLQDGHYSELADLFSFGVILSELDTELLPYSDLRNASGNPLTDTTIMAKVMAGQIQPTFSATVPSWFSALAKECLARNPSDRPSAMQVAYRLRLQVDAA